MFNNHPLGRNQQSVQFYQLEISFKCVITEVYNSYNLTNDKICNIV